MRAKEKARELVFQYEKYKWINHDLAQQCAIIAVNEILNNDSIGMSSDFNHLICDTDWWKEVKAEIIKVQP